MKKTFALAVAALLLAGIASAQPVTSAVSAEAVNSAVGRADNAGNLQNITINQEGASPLQGTIGWSGGERHDSLKTAPAIVAPGLTASPSTCFGSKSGGASVMGFGGTAAGTVEDDKCNDREFFKMYTLAGYPELGFAKLCAGAERATIMAGLRGGNVVLLGASEPPTVNSRGTSGRKWPVDRPPLPDYSMASARIDTLTS